MPERVLDTVILRVLAFAHPQGIDILLRALNAPIARLPAEGYNRDEDALPLTTLDQELSELARGLRWARRQANERPAIEAARYQAWLENARQLSDHLMAGTLIIDPLSIDELPRREELMDRFGIGRGEAAALVLAERHGVEAVFLSSDDQACQSAKALGIGYLTLIDVLDAWIERAHPTIREFDELVAGMRVAKFGLRESMFRSLRERLRV